ncbi:autotransporter domain-containing protein [Chitinimonas lacunae]|uniref:Autotransporter domain-containing protein n=1 Tax=Chitinimonas lacunae TaxID=1963018 RepID=A0ABV8MWC1_9NEIS
MITRRLRITALAAAIAATAAPVALAAPFSNVYFFGDSLTDSGAFGGLPTSYGVLPAGARNTTDDAKLYAHYVAGRYGFAVTPVNPINPTLGKGNNYAQGGARANGNANTTALSIGSQVGNYVRDHGGQVDVNALHVVWVGGNDVADALRVGATGTAADAQRVVSGAAQSTLQQVGQLKALGAKYVVVVNVPDLARVPRLMFDTSRAAASTVVNGTATETTARQLLGGINPALAANAQLVTATQSILRNAGATLGDAAVAAARAKLNAGGATPAEQQEAIKAAGTAAEQAIVTTYSKAVGQQIAGLLVQAGVLPAAMAETAAAGISGNLGAVLNQNLTGQISKNYAVASASAGQLVDSLLHPLLNAGLTGMGNVLQLDVNRLMKEVVANPTAYGFNNATGTACGREAIVCTSKDANFDASKSFFFSDEFHPTPLAHALMGDYMVSVLDAPMFASQLVNSQNASVSMARQSLEGRPTGARSVGQVDAFASASRETRDFDGTADSLANDGTNRAATVGLDYQATSNASVGVALTVMDHKTRFGNDRGGFNAVDRLMTAFGRYDMGAIRLGGEVFFGQTRFNKIDRTIRLGQAVRVERGDASGNQSGMRIHAGYELAMGQFSVTPLASLAYRSAKVSTYNEQGNSSTAMRFEQQRVEELIFGLGARAEAKMGGFVPFGSLMFYHDSKDNDRTVRAGLVNLGSTMEMPVFTPDRSFGTVNLGARFEMAKNVDGYLSYQRDVATDDEKRGNWTFGLQVGF